MKSLHDLKADYAAAKHLLDSAENSLGEWQDGQMKKCKTVDDYQNLLNYLPKNFRHIRRVYEAMERCAAKEDATITFEKIIRGVEEDSIVRVRFGDFIADYNLKGLLALEFRSRDFGLIAKESALSTSEIYSKVMACAMGKS